MPSLGIRGIVAQSMSEWCAQIRKIPFKRAWRNPVPYLEKDEIDELLRPRITRLSTANEITPCSCFSTTRGHEPPRRLES